MRIPMIDDGIPLMHACLTGGSVIKWNTFYWLVLSDSIYTDDGNILAINMDDGGILYEDGVCTCTVMHNATFDPVDTSRNQTDIA